MPNVMELAALLTPEYAFLLAALLAAGALAGLMAGLFGVGGGIVVVPVLSSVLEAMGYPHDLAMHLTLGTSLATIIATGYSSARAHWQRGSIDKKVLKRLMPATALGAGLGAVLAGHSQGNWLAGVFSVFAAVVAWQMARGHKGFVLASRVPDGWKRHLLGGGIGLFSSMLGIGGGTLSVPTLVACGYAMPVAAGTGSALGLAIALPGAAGFVWAGWGQPGLPPLSFGYVSLLAMAAMAPVSMLMAPLGARLAHSLPEVWLRRGFASFLAVVAVRMAYKAML